MRAMDYLLPTHEVHGAVLVLHGSGSEPWRVVQSPQGSLLGQTGLGISSDHLYILVWSCGSRTLLVE